MTCSGASRLISLVVDDSDDKTTTFTPLLFNFYLIPQAFLSRTESSQPLSVFRSVHLSPHFPSPLPSSPGAFCLFIPPCHELTTFFLSHCVFYMSRHFSSLFVPPLIPCGPLSLSRRPVKPTPFHLCPFIFVLFYPAAVSVSSSLSLLVSPILTSLCLVYFTLFFLSPQAHFGPLTSSAHLEGRAFAFHVHIFSSLNAAALMQREVCLICLSSLWHFLCTLRRGIIEHWGKLERERERSCSGAETEISKISLQQQEMVITVDQGIKLLPHGFPKYTLRVNRFHRSLSLSPGFPLPPFFPFFSYCLSNCLSPCLILSKKQNSGGDQIQWQSQQQLHPSSSLVRCIYSLRFSLAAPLGWASFAVSFYLFSDRDLQTLDSSPSHFCLSTLYLCFSATSVFSSHETQ